MRVVGIRATAAACHTPGSEIPRCSLLFLVNRAFGMKSFMAERELRSCSNWDESQLRKTNPV